MGEVAEIEAAPARRRFALSKRKARFVREVGGVVLGVLIALGIGELAEAVRWQLRVHNSMTAIHRELALTRGVAEERAMIQPCLDRRVEQLVALLMQVRGTGRLPDIGAIGRASARPIPRSAWEVTLGSGTTLHMSPQTRGEYANIYAMTEFLVAGLVDETRLWNQMSTLTHAPGPIDPDLLASLLHDLRDLEFASRFNSTIMGQAEAEFVRLGIATDRNFIEEYPGQSREAIRAQVWKSSACQPLIVDGKPLPEPHK